MNESERNRLLIAIQQRTGLFYRSDQLLSIERTLTQLMRRLDLDNPDDFVSAIDEDPDVYNQLVNEITVGETYFFREPKHFEFIRRQVIPGWRARRGASLPLRAWSAACASGEEAYSLAILCDQMSQPVDLLGTDISPHSIAQARRASYREWSFRGGAMAMVQNHFTEIHLPHHQKRYELSERLRRRVHFQLRNLASNTYPDRQAGIDNFDLILCRNVLIYFDRGTIDAIAPRLYESLAPGGWLITASGDPPLTPQANVDTITTEYGTFYQRHLAFANDETQPHSAFESPPHPTPRDTHTPRDPHTSEDARKPTSPADAVRGSRATLPGDAAQDQAAQDHVTQDHAPPSHTRPPSRTITAAREALASGNYDLAIRMTEGHLQHADACAIHVRSQARISTEAAIESCADAVARHPLATELHYLHASLLLDRDQLDEALRAIGRALFLDRSAVMVQFLSGSIQLRRGQWKIAYRHFENAFKGCTQQDPHALIPYSKRDTAAATAAAAESEMKKICDLLAKSP